MVAEADGQQVENIALPVGQLRERLRGVLRRGAGEELDDPVRHCGAVHRLAGGN